MKGFIFTAGNRAYFLKSENTRKTDKIITVLIDGIGKHRNAAPEVIERAKTDRATLDDFKRRTDAATLTERTTQNGFKYYSITGKNFTCNYPPEDFKNEVVIL